MGRRTRECYLCGTQYQYCPTCSQDRTKPAWMALFHSESCKNIFDICTTFNMKKMSKEEAQSALSSCDLTRKENFKSYVQRDLENIFAPEKSFVPVAEPKKRGKRAEIKVFDEVVNTEPIIIEPVVDPVIEESHEVVTETIENE